MDPHSESFKLLNEARDESHRFAITASRKKYANQINILHWIQLKV